MWLSKRKIGPKAGLAAVGQATLAGDPAGVLLDTERRALPVYAPGGYRWVPAVGQEVLVLGGDGDLSAIAGARSSGGGLAPGEVLISAGTGGARLCLKNDGSMELWGKLNINGADYVPYVPAPPKGV
ncbi:MAG: hypothetical protein RR403_01085 [Pseudoflavonifractor sp.]